MNKKLYYTICSSVIGVFLIIWCAAFLFFSFKPTPKHNLAEPQKNAQSTKQAEARPISDSKELSQSEYLIICENNTLNVYEIKNNEKIFIEALSIDVSNLLENDRNEFLRGVTVNSKTELAHIIEDYTS